MRRRSHPPHPLDHHPAFRAAIDAAPVLAELATQMREQHLVGTLAIACCDLADGFAAPPDSRRRIQAHQRAWLAVRDIDRHVASATRRRAVSKDVVKRAQRAIDRADVLIGALLPS